MVRSASRMSAVVSRVQADDAGITLSTREDIPVDVLFDNRRIWSFWPIRDGEAEGDRYLIGWPPMLQRFLQGDTRLKLVEHVSGIVVFDQEVHFGDAAAGERIAVVNSEGKPLGLDKSNRLAQTFDTRSPEQIKPLLDAIETVLDALRRAGIEAFPAYGTLLGAVRDGALIGHDSDADLGYVSDYTHPVDVARESFRLQRRLADMGFTITRYSAGAFKVDVAEADGSVRGLDVFGGFLNEGKLILMGEIRTDFRRDWIFPLGTTTLEGRTLPAPANTDKFLSATYGPGWRVPDPAFHFGTPRSTHRRLNGWFRGTRINREEWDRHWSQEHRKGAPRRKPHAFARWVKRREPDLTQLIDVGCGRGTDALWFARRGVSVVGLDYSAKSFASAAEIAETEGLPAEFAAFNLLELRQTLSWGSWFAHTSPESAQNSEDAPAGRRVILARHIADATNRVGRAHLWRFASMALRGGGRLYLEVLTPGEPAAGAEPSDFETRNYLRPVSPELIVAELEATGATIVERVDRGTPSGPDSGADLGTDELGSESSSNVRPRRGRRITRLVVEWQA